MTRTDIANMALSKLGAEPITDLATDDTKEAVHCRIWYDQVLREVLRAHFWNFALGVTRVGKAYISAKAATLRIGSVIADNAIDFTALVPGIEGNSISITVAEATPNSVFGVAVSRKAITIQQEVRTLDISGETTPALPASLQRVATPSETYAAYGLPMFSNDGEADGATTLGSYLFFLTSSLTLAELAPPALYTAAMDPAKASMVQRFDPVTGWDTKWLYLNPVPGGYAPRWVTLGGTVDAGSTVFPAASRINVQRANDWPAGGGPLGAAFATADTNFSWLLTSGGKVWEGIGKTPWQAVYAPLIGSPTGNPEITGNYFTAAEAVQALADDPDASLLVTATHATGSAGGGYLYPIRQTNLVAGQIAYPDWENFFLIPDDFVKLRKVMTTDGDKIDSYDIRRVKGYRCLVAGDHDSVMLEYVGWVDTPDDYEPMFVAAFTTLLASKMAHAITGSAEYEQSLLARYLNEELPAARVADSHDTQSAENHPLGEFLAGDLLKQRTPRSGQSVVTVTPSAPNLDDTFEQYL